MALRLPSGPVDTLNHITARPYSWSWYTNSTVSSHSH